MRRLRIIGSVVGLLAVCAAAAAVAVFGPRNVWGLLRYDQRAGGSLHVGDTAPDVTLTALDGVTRSRLLERAGNRPLVLVFGSFT